MKKISILISFLCLIVFISCNKDDTDNIENIKANYSFSEEMRFTLLDDAFNPIDSFYLSVEEPLMGSIEINHTKGIVSYIINGLNLNIDDKINIDNLIIQTKDNEIVWMHSKSILASFCASYVELKSSVSPNQIKFVETEDVRASFHVGTSLDTARIRVTGCINIESL